MDLSVSNRYCFIFDFISQSAAARDSFLIPIIQNHYDHKTNRLRASDRLLSGVL